MAVATTLQNIHTCMQSHQTIIISTRSIIRTCQSVMLLPFFKRDHSKINEEQNHGIYVVDDDHSWDNIQKTLVMEHWHYRSLGTVLILLVYLTLVEISHCF